MNCDGETLYFRTRMKRRAADFLKALDEGKLTESQEAHRFTIVYSTLSRDEKVIYIVIALTMNFSNQFVKGAMVNQRKCPNFLFTVCSH